MSITSFLSEGEKTCSLRSRKEATATVFGVSKVTSKRDSSIIQINPAVVKSFSAKGVDKTGKV